MIILALSAVLMSASPMESQTAHVHQESFVEKAEEAELEFDLKANCCCRIVSPVLYMMGTVTGFAGAILAGLTIDQTFDVQTRTNLAISSAVFSALSGLLSAITPAVEKMVRDKDDRIKELEMHISEEHGQSH